MTIGGMSGLRELTERPFSDTGPVTAQTGHPSRQRRLVKTGGRLVRHARYYWLLLAESHLTRRLFASMLQRIWALPVPTG